jgi:hypothetical protein
MNTVHVNLVFIRRVRSVFCLRRGWDAPRVCASTSTALVTTKVSSNTRRGKNGMTTMTITLPHEVAAQIEAQHISQQQLEAFVVTAVKAWLHRPQVRREAQNIVTERPWSEAFQDSAVDFVDRLIDENTALFAALARL